MFCSQQRFDLPTTIVTRESFRAMMDSAQTRWLTQEHRRVRGALPAVAAGDAELLRQWEQDAEFVKFCRQRESSRKAGVAAKFRQLSTEQKLKAYCDALKRRLPFVVFIATFAESVSAGGKLGAWRKQSACRLNGLCVIDFDHIEGDCREVWSAAVGLLTDEDRRRLLLVYVTPSGHGLKVVFTADAEVGNLLDNQRDFSRKLGLSPDEACKDASRGAFLTTREDVILIDEERLFSYENEDFGRRFDERYHGGDRFDRSDRSNRSNGPIQPIRPIEPIQPIEPIITAWLGDADLTNNRHNTLVELASHLRYLLGKNPKRIEEAVMTLPWVQELAAEGENIGSTVASVMDFKFYEHMPKRLQEAMRKAGCTGNSGGSDDDTYAQLPFDQWADELEQLAAHFPCMRELFVNVHPHKRPAVLFSAAALYGTLMTRTWYHFWYEPEVERRLNYCIFIIGSPGSGKNAIEKLYLKIADPMIQADKGFIDAVNHYKDGRTERSTSTKAQKGEALKKPVVGIRVHPARTSNGEFIRHMLAAREVVQGREMNLHMFSFDSELDNVTKNSRGGDYKDREVFELKCFHNEQDGQMYANQESITGMFNVYWNFIYTGTPYALHRKVNQRTFGTGMSTRLAVIPMPDRGMAERHQQVDPTAGETLSMWAYRLDRAAGELPIEALNDETYEWQASRMEIAEFNADKADRTLLKRIPYYGIGVSLPFIVMRHWDEWEAHRTLTLDATDRQLCRLAMDIQYRCQQFFFGEMAYNHFADQNKELVVRRRTTRYDMCFSKLPDEFQASQFAECFGMSHTTAWRAIARLQQDRAVEKIKFGVYRKLVHELP